MLRFETLASLLKAENALERVICLDGAQPRTVAALQNDVAGIARQLPDGIAAAVFCQSGYWFLVGMLAVWLRQGTVVLPPNAQPAMLADLAEQFDILLTDAEVVFDGPVQILVENAGDEGSAPGALPTASACRMVFFTSGSTDRPKAIAKTLAQLESESRTLERQWGSLCAESDMTVGLVSHQHIYGMLFRIIWPLLAGRCFLARMIDYWESLEALTCLSRPVVVASPAHLQRIPGWNGPRPAAVFSSGGPLPLEAACAATNTFGCAPIEVFGSTETGGIAYRCQEAGQEVTWTPLPGVGVSASEEGRLTVKSDHLGQAQPLITDDCVRFVDDSRFLVTGRLGKVVKIEGKRVSLAQIESALAHSTLVAEVAVLMTGERGAELGALVVLSGPGQTLLHGIGAFRLGRKMRQDLAGRFDNAALPRRWRFVERIPVNPQGKRPLAEMQALFSRGTVEERRGDDETC